MQPRINQASTGTEIVPPHRKTSGMKNNAQMDMKLLIQTASLFKMCSAEI